MTESAAAGCKLECRIEACAARVRHGGGTGADEPCCSRRQHAAGADGAWRNVQERFHQLQHAFQALTAGSQWSGSVQQEWSGARRQKQCNQYPSERAARLLSVSFVVEVFDARRIELVKLAQSQNTVHTWYRQQRSSHSFVLSFLLPKYISVDYSRAIAAIHTQSA